MEIQLFRFMNRVETTVIGVLVLPGQRRETAFREEDVQVKAAVVSGALKRKEQIPLYFQNLKFESFGHPQ